eukprot:CAMPEP_0182453614 /NCGR_PEP_ID=MMETSP1319-20130603/600_1 /TAXON_ID=172717 /ORGANISM="Bolidomonas pacifica, Strain RCC208" /LENGTH=389 /DNA_ID=CAMNT_0024651561 /DNA_START=165 /DNA_END=1334 /DNA_ORIENTATION=-
MGLTAAIFGMSTLLSSYSIYNVSKLIGEDALQHLALFSEYGRMALNAEDDDSASSSSSSSSAEKPFQKVEFLVRDWQNFDNDDPQTDEDFEEMEREMDEYVKGVIKERDAKDLAETRQQIATCFEKVDCYLLTHPGFEVTKKKYDGDPKLIEPTFVALLDRYCKKVFNSELEPKRIHGRYLTSQELAEYVKAYAKMFKTGSEFPQATTMLAATAEANNTNAKSLAVAKYKSEMDRWAGPSALSYTPPEEFEKHHVACASAALELFDGMANFGSKGPIDEARADVEAQIGNAKDVYFTLNEGRNPLAGWETYYLPVLIALGSWVLRTITDLTCSGWSETCKAGSDALGQIYGIVLIFMLIVGATKAKQIGEKLGQIKSAMQLVMPHEKAS